MKYSINRKFSINGKSSINRKYSINQIYSITVINHFGTEISKRLLHRGPDGHWGSRHYTVRLFILCGYIFSEYVMERKNYINQPNATSVTFLLIMQGFWAHTYYDVLKTLQDSKTALISQFWSVMVLSVGSLMPSVMQSHMGFIVTLFTWYVMGQVMQSIDGLAQHHFHHHLNKP